MKEFTSQQCREIMEHRSIPWGGVKLIGGFILTMIVTFSVSMPALTLLSNPATMLSRYSPMWQVVFFIAMCFVISCIMLSFNPGSWIKSYFARNVRGYRARFWLNDECTHSQIVSSTTTAFSCVRPPKIDLIIEVPLGGWFSGKTGIIRHCIWTSEHSSNLSNWSVRFHAILDSNVLLEVYYHDKLSGVDTRLVFVAKAAIELLQLARTREIQRSPVNPSTAIVHLMHENAEVNRIRMDSVEKLGRYMQENTDLSTECRQLSASLLQAVDALKQVEHTIRGFDRLKDRIEGCELRLRVLRHIEGLLSASDVQGRVVIEARIEEAAAALEEARRRQRRSGSSKPKETRPQL